ncbi:MAG: hypothetical protein EOL87_05970 [Spartobacteria bacterium]|nr:hypothetical protein [Spartobacteria bacterium]
MAEVKQDFSSFMTILIMAIGSLVIVLVCNVVVIISNPDNLSISTIVLSAYDNTEDAELSGRLGQPLFSNKEKQPSYIDVYEDRLIIYPDQSVVPMADLEIAGNAFEQMLDRVEAIRDTDYIVLVLRPGSAHLARIIRRAVNARGIDLGQELYEADREMGI